MSADPLAPHLRARLARIADGLIPGTEDMPAPGSLDIGGRQADLVLASRPDLAEGLRRALEAGDDAGDPIAWVERLASTDPPAHAALVTVVVAGYDLHPEVQQRLGYPGRPGRSSASTPTPTSSTRASSSGCSSGGRSNRRTPAG